MGLRAQAATLPELFEEAAAALGELAADVAANADDAPIEVAVERESADLPGLAYAWLDELIGLAELGAAAVAGASVASVVESPDGWRIRAVARLVPYAGGAARPRLGVKSPTYHRLSVERRPDGGWTLVAYLDV